MGIINADTPGCDIVGLKPDKQDTSRKVFKLSNGFLADST